MAKKIWALANATDGTVTFSSTEHPQDTRVAPPFTNIHTGGDDGNFSKIADCSAEKYYNDHHMTVAGPNVNLTFWDNDDQKGLLYFSTNGTFAGGRPYQGSANYESCTLLIYRDRNGNLQWTVANWDNKP